MLLSTRFLILYQSKAVFAKFKEGKTLFNCLQVSSISLVVQPDIELIDSLNL